jgi:hypothetical protein
VFTPPVVAGDPASYVIIVQWSEAGEAAPITFQIGFQT